MVNINRQGAHYFLVCPYYGWLSMFLVPCLVLARLLIDFERVLSFPAEEREGKW